MTGFVKDHLTEGFTCSARMRACSVITYPFRNRGPGAIFCEGNGPWYILQLSQFVLDSDTASLAGVAVFIHRPRA
jgi:hypothetical protein